MLAIIKTGGKQYKIKEGDEIEIEKADFKKDEEIVFEEVLFISDEKNQPKIGAPFVEGVKVIGRVTEEKRGKKVKTIKHKAKKRYLVRKNHRQELLKVKIEKIKG